MAVPIELAEGLVSSLCVEEPEKRDSALDSWRSESRDSLISLFEEELDAYLDHLRERMLRPGSVETQRRRAEQTLYEFVVTVKATYARDEDGNAVRRHPAAAASPSELSSRAERANYEGAEDDWDGDSGRSPNDDRSDSMNPNNDAYEAAMDNRSDQMNPNNDAYWSSRGR